MENYFWHFPSFLYLPVGNWIQAFVDWLTVAAKDPFNVISLVLGHVLNTLNQFFVWLPWPVVVLGVAAIGWRLGGRRLGLGVGAGMMLLGVLGIWNTAMNTLALVVTGTLISIAVGVPVGILTARSVVVRRLVTPLLDFMQTLPSFVYLIPALYFFGLGAVPGVIATFIYAVPPAIRLTELGIRSVPAEVVEAGNAFGSTPRQLLVKVQLPMALPSIMAGVNQTIMMALAMVVVASMIGTSGLGESVLRAIGRLEVGTGFVAGTGIVILAIVLDRLSQHALKSRRSSVAG